MFRFILLTRSVVPFLIMRFTIYSCVYWILKTLNLYLFQYFLDVQSQYPRLVVEDFSPLPSKGQTGKDGWYNLLFTLGLCTIVSQLAFSFVLFFVFGAYIIRAWWSVNTFAEIPVWYSNTNMYDFMCVWGQSYLCVCLCMSDMIFMLCSRKLVVMKWKHWYGRCDFSEMVNANCCW